MNPVYAHHNPQMTNLSQLYQMMNTQNPMAVFNQIALMNPNLQPILNTLKMGANPQNVFNELCKQKGINPNAFIDQIKGNIR